MYSRTKQIILGAFHSSGKMTETSINVNIAGRTYPVKAKSGETSNVHRAADLVNSRLKELMDNYSVKDKQDLLSMCALQLALQYVVLEKNVDSGQQSLAVMLNGLDTTLSDYLSKKL